MKKQIITLALIPALLLSSCANVNDQAIITAIGGGTSLALQFGVKDSARRTVIANYINVYAGALRTISGSPTAVQLVGLLNQAVPASVRADFPELTTFVYPLIISGYQLAQKQFGTNAAKIYQWANDTAVGLENGSAAYISGPITVSP